LAHGAFFVNTRVALREHVKLLVLRQELDVHAMARGLPGSCEQSLLQLAQSSSACEPSSSRKAGGTSSGKKSISMAFPPLQNISNWPHTPKVGSFEAGPPQGNTSKSQSPHMGGRNTRLLFFNTCFGSRRRPL
jgi:hypothetical protein